MRRNDGRQYGYSNEQNKVGKQSWASAKQARCFTSATDLKSIAVDNQILGLVRRYWRR